MTNLKMKKLEEGSIFTDEELLFLYTSPIHSLRSRIAKGDKFIEVFKNAQNLTEAQKGAFTQNIRDQQQELREIIQELKDAGIKEDTSKPEPKGYEVTDKPPKREENSGPKNQVIGMKTVRMGSKVHGGN